MVTLTISEALAEKLNQRAEREHRSIEAVLDALLEVQSAPEVAPRIEDDPRYQEARRQLMPKLYARARRYWEKHGDQERLALTEAEFNERFWFFDAEDVPRLHGDEAVINEQNALLRDEFQRLYEESIRERAGNPISEHDLDTRTILNTEFVEYLEKRMDRQ